MTTTARALALVLTAALTTGALPQKVLVDDAGKDLAPVTLILGQVKVDGWSPAQGRIEQITSVISLPRTQDASGRFIVPPKLFVAQSEKGATKSTAWAGEMARKKADKGIIPIALCSPQVLAVRHPTPIDAAQTLRDFALFFHVDGKTGATTTIAYWQGKVVRLPEGSTIMNEMVVDESSFFVPTKTHTEGMRFPTKPLPAPSDDEKKLLLRAEHDLVACATLIERLVTSPQ